MGKHDRRCSQKMSRRKAQAKKKNRARALRKPKAVEAAPKKKARTAA